MPDMDELPADAAAVALAGPITRDAMADLVEAAKLLDIDMDHVAGMISLITTHRFGRLQVTHPVQSQTPQDAADSRWRHAPVRSDLFACKTLPAQDFDLFDDRRRRRPVETFRPRRAIHQTRSPLGFEAGNPFARRPRADACGFCDGLRPLPAQHLQNQTLSTQRRRPGILVHVHPVPPWTPKLRNLSFLGPDRMDNLLRAHN
jgi:hypothetical protein